ncbi:MAG: septal ring lytic transglycosylase RlpA family protein [Bacteroidales bacterium]|nr:septal ring lytic transglycosylase RlpA family protein [Bacteroidales bacterium]
MRLFISILLSVNFIFISIAQNGYVEIGRATYYSNKFEGRKTTSGERYFKTKYSAAHPKMPLGTYVRVTNLKNNKSVVVKVNDRCPVRKTRIIDLSRVAAHELGMINIGVCSVKVEQIDTFIKDYSKYFIRVATCKTNQGALNTIKTFLPDHRKNAFIVTAKRGNQYFYKILVGPYLREEEAEEHLRSLIKRYRSSYMLRVSE